MTVKEKEQVGPPKTYLYVSLLLLGSLAGSTAVIMIKAGTEHPMLVASYRLLVAALVLTPAFIRALAINKPGYGWTQFKWTMLPSLFLAAHFITWVIGARATPVTNASLINNLTPVALPFFLWLFYREKITWAEGLGTIIAMTGLFILSGRNLSTSSDIRLGDTICFLSMLTLAGYFALGRKNNNRLNLWLYVVPMYYMSGMLCLLAACFYINPVKSYTTQNILYIIGLGLIPTVVGHSLYNYSLKHLRGQLVGLINLVQPFMSAILGFLLLGEIPLPAYYLAAVLVVCGVVIAIRSQPNNAPPRGKQLADTSEKAIPSS